MTLPSAPVFLAQQTWRGRAHNRLAPVATARAAGNRTPPGLLLDFGAVHLRGVRDDAANRGTLAPLLADGDTYDTPTKQRVPTAGWVQRSAPSNRTTWDATIKEALEEQRALNTDALCVPGVELTSGGYPNELDKQADAVRRAWATRVAGDPAWLARFCLHDDWLTDGTKQRFALNLITDLPDDIGISLHIRFGKRDAAFDANVLRPLRDFVQVLADDGRRVLMVQSGFIGWLSIAWGAWGFSAGTSQGSWLDTGRARFGAAPGRRRPPPLERYLEGQLIHHVLWSDHSRLVGQPGYAQCPCLFCQTMATGGWDINVTAQHGLYALAELTQRVAGSDRPARRAAVRTVIEAAQNQWATWSTGGLSTLATPRGLPVWRSLV